MARKRRTKYTWLPNTGTAGPGADVEDTTNGRDFGAIVVPTNGTTALSIVDLLVDEAPEDQAAGQIGQYLTSEYFIKRIVGKFFVNMLSITSAVVQKNAIVAAGIFVARAEDIDIQANQPIGAVGAGAIDNYSPLRAETIREPWIWRRTWLLGNPQSTFPDTETRFPSTNAEYGSVLDGPHVDAKTARRVGNDERLWAVVACRNYPLNAANGDAPNSIRAYFDYRVLGAARRARNRSAF